MHQGINYFLTICMVMFGLVLSGCASLDLEGKVRGDLLNSRYLSSNSADDIAQVLNHFGVGDRVKARYEVDSYRISYATVDTDGKLIAASGLLAVPAKERGNRSPVIAYHHGTIFLHDDAPSENYLAKETEIVVASLGFIVSSADYVGYGVASDRLHPYLQSETLANTSIDMLRASRQFLQQREIAHNDQLFLSGYSEGGYATLSTQKMMQQQFPEEFDVTLSLPGGGAYSLLWTVEDVLSRSMSFPAYVGFTFKAYNDIYELDRLDQMFGDYAEQVDSLYDGKSSSGEINRALNSDPQQLFAEPFLNEFLGDGELELKQLFLKNSLVEGWTPSSETIFYHGEQDVIVPIENAHQAIDNMRAAGAKVSLVLCQPMGNDQPNHADCSIPYALFSIATLSQVAEDL